MGDVDLEALFDYIIEKTEEREGFSPVKEANIGFSAIEDMKALRNEFISAETELELWFALKKLSNARRDRHLYISPVDGGLSPPERQPTVCAPIRVLPEIRDVHNPIFFVAAVEEGTASPRVGDVIVGVNGLSMKEYIDEFGLLWQHSTLPQLYWETARFLPRRLFINPLNFYSERLHLTLERPSGQRYNVALPYGDDCPSFSALLRFTDPYAGFQEIMRRENFNVFLDRDQQIVLLEWEDFEYSMIQDVFDLTEYAEQEEILDWDLIIDFTYSSGGSRGAFAIQRLVDQRFKTTFGNVRLSDLGVEKVQEFAARQPNYNAPDFDGLNLSDEWLIEWARTDAMDAINSGLEYTPNVPFKLAHLPKDSDGYLEPAEVHFTGDMVLVNARTRGGSHLDQFAAMLVDNDLAYFIGIPTGGFSNTWEGYEVLQFNDTGQPLVRFMWSIGHTLRPNGEILEGNPPQPDMYFPITRENFRDYHKMLIDTAINELGR